jgi:hypothetical protein
MPALDTKVNADAQNTYTRRGGQPAPTESFFTSFGEEEVGPAGEQPTKQ